MALEQFRASRRARLDVILTTAANRACCGVEVRPRIAGQCCKQCVPGLKNLQEQFSWTLQTRDLDRIDSIEAGRKHVLCHDAKGSYNRDMLRFHIILQAAAQPWGVTFDEAFVELEQVTGVFIEPDGSFFRASRPGEPQWQVEGNLYDQGVRLAYVELKGCCPEERLNELLGAFGWPEVPMEFQMVREGILLRDEEFRMRTRM